MSFYCPVCFKIVPEKCDAIQCDTCNFWVHQANCSGLPRSQFLKLTKPANSDEWHCPICMKLPDSDVFTTNLNDTEPPTTEDLSDNSNSDTSGSNVNENLIPLLTDINKIVGGLVTNDDEDDELELQFHSNSCSYASCDEFKSILSENPSETSAFHLNIASIYY